MRPIKKIKLVISQPRVASAPSEYDLTPEELTEFVEKVRKAAILGRGYVDGSPAAVHHGLNPSEEACMWCKAKATCPKLTEFVTTTVSADFNVVTAEQLECTKYPDADDPAKVAEAYGKLALIEMWCKAVAVTAYKMAEQGIPLPGLKMVAGKKGNRAWDNPEEVEAEMKAMRIKQDEMYNYTLVTPAQAEKTIAEAYPRKWKKLADRITQKDGKPTLVSEDDKRPALDMKKPADEFAVSLDDLM